jgi:hypothetical protein
VTLVQVDDLVVSARSVQSERNTRARIRERMTDALLDFETLVEGLSGRDRALLFERVV